MSFNNKTREGGMSRGEPLPFIKNGAVELPEAGQDTLRRKVQFNAASGGIYLTSTPLAMRGSLSRFQFLSSIILRRSFVL